ncbi:hypothetical protein [Stenotrophomonas sp.]|uniref:hypothetical protein n=1 Tax=Stenotrophomonas sp. TaxID=69392 RepID=UPI0028AC4591|nr:hypothetical protein [Stenotrophomonas sp.]
MIRPGRYASPAWLLPAMLLAAATAQAAPACVEDTLPGRLADAPVRLCVDAADGDAPRYTLRLADAERIAGEEAEVMGVGLQGDWYGHPLRLHCRADGAVRHCDLSVDGEPAWNADLAIPNG